MPVVAIVVQSVVLLAQPLALIAGGQVPTLLERCRQGRTASCDELAEAAARMQVGQGRAGADPAGALRIYLELCDLKHAMSCALAAHLYDQGAAGVATDLARALALYRTACDLGDGGSCLAFVHMLAADRKAERVQGEGLVYLERGCSLKSAASCESAAAMRRALGDGTYDGTLKRAREALRALSEPAGGGAGSIQPRVPADRAGTVRLTLPGWVEEKPQGGTRAWRDADGDVLSLTVVPDFSLPVTEPELRRAARQIAEHSGGGLIEVAVVAPAPRAVVSLVYKWLRRPAYLYSGMLIMACRDFSLVWVVVSGERGTTGVREATITTELMKTGELTPEAYERSWAQDPYDPAYRGVDRSVLRFMSDDRRYDARFPQHPLSKVRRVLAALPASVGGVQ